MELLLATTNRHKVVEFQRLAIEVGIRLIVPGIDGPEPLAVSETGQTFLENARSKARAYLQAYRMPVLADDSGLCVDALAGAPGVHSARFGPRHLDDAGRVHYLLQQMSTISPPKRTAHYVCALALARPDVPAVFAEGMCYGEIASEPRGGDTGFGYDPVFVLPALGMAISELSPAQKDVLGHRGKALRRLLSSLSLEDWSQGTLKM
jgi:XTP/dITP diphosphohydrolase